MMAGVSMRGGEWRAGFWGNGRWTYGRNSARVWNRQPLARLTSSTPRPFHSSRSSASRCASVSAPTSSSNSRLSSATPRGSCDASSTASRMRFASAGLCMAQFYVNRGEAFGLRDLDQQLARQLEQREEGDHQDRHPPARLEQLGELKDAPLAQAAPDAAHVLAHPQLFSGNVVVP